MGYTFTCKGGRLHLKNNESADKALSILESVDIDGDFESRPKEGEDGPSVFNVYGGAGYSYNYHEEDFEKLAPLCGDESYLDILGEDDSLWSLVFKDGKTEAVNGIMEWRPEKDKVYIINKTCSEGFWYGNEAMPITAGRDMNIVIREAYFGQGGYKAVYEETDDALYDDEPMLKFKEFAKIMEQGFVTGYGQEKEGYVILQYDDYHIQFEPYVVEI